MFGNQIAQKRKLYLTNRERFTIVQPIVYRLLNVQCSEERKSIKEKKYFTLGF